MAVEEAEASKKKVKMVAPRLLGVACSAFEATPV